MLVLLIIWKTPKGYDVRGLDADIDLTDYEFIERSAVANVL
jgi:hypothetical protein